MGMIPSKITQKGPQNLIRSIKLHKISNRRSLASVSHIYVATLAQARTLVSYLLTKKKILLKSFNKI